jgi:hypothetical protein
MSEAGKVVLGSDVYLQDSGKASFEVFNQRNIILNPFRNRSVPFYGDLRYTTN